MAMTKYSRVTGDNAEQSAGQYDAAWLKTFMHKIKQLLDATVFNKFP